MASQKQKENLTNEYLNKNFSDNFDVALSSIDVAKSFIQSGKSFTLSSLLDAIAKSAAKSEPKEEVQEEEWKKKS